MFEIRFLFDAVVVVVVAVFSWFDCDLSCLDECFDALLFEDVVGLFCELAFVLFAADAADNTAAPAPDISESPSLLLFVCFVKFVVSFNVDVV